MEKRNPPIQNVFIAMTVQRPNKREIKNVENFIMN